MCEKLVYVEKFCEASENEHYYMFYYSDVPDIVWGVDWNIYSPVNCEDTRPEETTISSREIVKLTLSLKTAEELSAYSMEYCTFNMLALAWIDIENLEEYPENGRCVLHFGDDKEKVKELISPYFIEY